MSNVTHNQVISCPHCGEETANYEDCVLCGHSLEDENAPARDVSMDELQKMMAGAKLEELKIKREMLYGDAWDHAPWLERLLTLAEIAPHNAKLYQYIGQAHVEQGECRHAIVYFTRSLMEDPDLADAMRLRADCQSALVVPLMSDPQIYYDRAIADYEAAIDIDPDVYTHNALAAIIGSLGEWDKAIENYTSAIELDTDYAESFFNRGYTYKVMGEKDKAIADFQAFLNFKAHWNKDMASMAESHIKELTEPDF